MSEQPFLLAQLSDPHIGAEWGGGDPEAGLRAVGAAIDRLVARPDALLVSGDLADNAADAEYEFVRELLEALGLPAYVLPGNHDDRASLRRHFALPGEADDPVQYAVDLGPLRLVVLDTTRPGEDPGALDSERLGWLDAELARAPGQTTLIAMHHQPFLTGVAKCDAVALAPADCEALASVIARHPQVRRIVTGHLHSPVAAELAGCSVLSAPSTYVQVKFGYSDAEISFVPDRPGFVLHALADGELRSYVMEP